MLNSPIEFKSGHKMKNRFMLAPMTNTQSHEDGRLSDDEYHWLTKRAEGGFGLVMTCASHVQEIGKGFPGQLGIFSDIHIHGHKRLSSAIKEKGALAVIQLHHAGMRTPADLIQGKAVCPSDSPKHNARALTLEEVRQLKEDFIQAAKRAQVAGYDGVEVHGAHGYILTQFLSATINQRTDEYGGSFENRSKLIFEIIEGIRATCGHKFLLGLRLSPERFGMDLNEIKSLCLQLIEEDQLDFLDISLWDVYKKPHQDEESTLTLLDHFKSLDFKNTKWTVAGNIRHGQDVMHILNQDVDFVSIGRSAILHYDFPKQVSADMSFQSQATPVTEAYLKDQGLGPDFIHYMKRWPDFVKE